MNRREMLSAMGATVASIGGCVEYVDTARPLLVKIKTERLLTTEQRHAIHLQWKSIARDSPLSGIPVVILDCGTDIEIVADERIEDDSSNK